MNPHDESAVRIVRCLLIRIVSSLLKNFQTDTIHKGLPEFFTDGDLFTADENMIVPDGIHPGDIDNIRVVHPYKGGG